MEIFLRIASYLLLFIIGAILANKNIIKRQRANSLLWFIFYIGLPITVFGAIMSTRLQPTLLYLPFIAMIITSIVGFFAWLTAKLLHLPKKQTGVLLIATMIMNTGLSLPFFGAFYGEEGIAIFSIFDIGNLFMIFTVIYAIALHYGNKTTEISALAKRFFSTPTVWVIIIALSMNFAGLTFTGQTVDSFRWINLANFLLVMFTLGLYFEAKIHHLKLVILGMTLRYCLGFFVGLFVVTLFSIEGLPRLAVLIAAASPNGYTSLVYANLAKLDIKYTASLVSLSLAVGLIIIPTLLFIFR